MKIYSETAKLAEALSKISVKCRCSHTMVIPPKIDRMICDWCGYYVYKDPKEQFKYELRKKGVGM